MRESQGAGSMGLWVIKGDCGARVLCLAPPWMPLISMRLAQQRGGRGRTALQLISTRMLSGATHTLILLIIITATAAVSDTHKDVSDGSPLIPPRQVAENPHSIPQGRPLGPLHVPPSRLSDGKKTLKTKAKLTLDNNTGLRKTDVHQGNSLPANGRSTANQYGGPGKGIQDRNRPDPILSSSPSHALGVLDYESNRPGKMSPKAAEASQNSSRAAWISNRHPTSLLQQYGVLRKDPDSKERMCLPECHKERDEREAYCYSDFAVNGIIHDVDNVGRGVQLLTVLVNSGGFYKMNRLYITPDGVFFRVTILAVDNPHCPKPCLHLKLGGRYIIMGQIYHKRMELPSSIQRAVSGRLRAGDGLVTSGRSFIRRFNRKKDRRVLAAAHSKCK
ncbi:UPF0450 protein C17orf58 homolog [Leptodactylus fuscus]|uniref:UPF0450 protein C17orf58 homolog n=1 Tax=Leptodactylus fuscus TaxID=238119 RepID=UPI003F4F1DF4